MNAPITIREHRHRLLITGHDLMDFVLVTSLIIITIKFWNWFLPILFA